MIAFLLLLITLLLFTIGFQVYLKRSLQKQLRSIKKQLTDIVHGQASGPVLIGTDHKQIAELLVSMNKLIDQNREHARQFIRTEQSMKRMLSNISHDLKTPLTVISGYAEMLNEKVDMPNQERERILSHIHEKTDEMTTLIDSFFDLAKLEAGDKHLPLEAVNLTEICKRSILLFYEFIETKGLDVHIDLPDSPVFALGNEEALHRILANLVSNALRYGADGNVIGLHVYAEEDFVVIEVYDQGIGIPESDQQHIFERMYTLEESRNKDFQGSGLGLTITKKLIEQMQGTISVSSIPHEKTSFICKLKREKG
ncbi:MULTISPECIES: sensor histidine kinase [Shouchella]|uniref:histidine kinase n=1 Tax=Shouchella hunanensis TaxID=766894 RepID=A0ABY7W9D6_9BACI|nr:MULTISPECIES: HAMP domain-containing sensor histidine kinase [Shouchella]WDF03315.1 HAMP domain-containing sensor histidine kinase [Shouchella hunanensis]